MLRLIYKSTTTIPVEAEVITPDQLAGKSAAEVAALPVQHGNAEAPLGEFFTVEGDATDRDIVIKCLAEDKDPNTCTAAELAQGHVTYVEADADMDSIVELMGREQVKRMPVIEDHQLVGMISESDLAKHLDEERLSTFVERVFGRR